MRDEPANVIADMILRERDLWNAFAARDRARLERLIHPDALDVGVSGIKRREDVLEAVALMNISAVELFDVRRFRPADAVEVVTYRATVDGTYRGTPFDARDVAATSVWLLRDGEWKLVHRTEVPLRPAIDQLDEPAG